MSLDWHPLADTDPLPGDPDEIRRASRDADATADLLEEQAAALEQLAAADGWESETVDVLRSEAGELAAALRRVVPRYRTVGEALRQWAPALEDCQARGRRALRDAQEAQHRADSVAALPPLPADAAATPDGVIEQHARTQRHDAATHDLERARAQLAHAVRDRDEAAERAARAIRAVARHDGLRDGRWDGVRGALDAVGGAWGAVRGWVHRNARWFRLASAVLGWIATVAGLLALFVPVLAPVAGLIAGMAGGLAALADVILAANGDGSWTSVGFDLAGVVLGKFGARTLKSAGARLRAHANAVEGKAAAKRVRTYSRPKLDRARAAAQAPGATDADRAAAAYARRSVKADIVAAREAAVDRVLGATRRRDARFLDGDAARVWSHARNLSRAHAGDVRTARAVREARRAVRRAAAARGIGLALDLEQKIEALVPLVGANGPSATKPSGRRPSASRTSRRSAGRQLVRRRRAARLRGSGVYGPYVPARQRRHHRHPLSHRTATRRAARTRSAARARRRAAAR